MITRHTFTMINRKEAPYIDYIRNGEKLAEVRIFSPGYKRLKINDTVLFHNRKEGIICKVVFLHTYTNFETMLKNEGVDTVLPQLKNQVTNLEEKIKLGIQIYESFPNAYKVKQLGCIAIGVKFIKNHFI